MDIDDHDKTLAALEQLEAERARRLQDKIDSGEAVSIQTTVVVEAREDTENACERALSNLPTSTPDGRPIHHDLIVVVTGVPRDAGFGNWVPPQIQTASSEGADHPDEVEPAAGVLLSSRSRPAYIFTTTRPATNDGDPGQIAEALWSVDDGAVVLTNLEGRHITGRALLKDEDPAAVARSLLREAEEPKDFHRPINYPKLGLA
jgi:hypothetical protein